MVLPAGGLADKAGRLIVGSGFSYVASCCCAWATPLGAEPPDDAACGVLAVLAEPVELAGLVNRMWDVNYSDLCYGYNAFWRRHLPDVVPDCSGFEVETLMNIRVARSHLRIVEVPSFEADRLHGVSNLHARRDGMRVLRTILAERVRPR